MNSIEGRTKKTLRLVWGLLVSGIVAWGGANTAQAGEPEGVFAHKVVSFRDLNLNNPEGVEALYKRIRSAAHEVCADPLRYDLSEFKLRPCIDDAMSRAIAQVNNAKLTSLYESKGGKVDKKTATFAQAK